MIKLVNFKKGGIYMDKKKFKILIVFLCIIIFSITFYFIKKKAYETKLEDEMFSYAVQHGIPKENIKKTNMKSYSKGQRYEYEIYINNLDDNKYFIFSYVLKESPFKTYLFQEKIDTTSIDSSAYIDGSVVGLEDKMAKPLLDKIQ